MSGAARIYLDHNATTPLRAEVAEEMARVLRDVFGNPSSIHAEGQAARAVLEAARERAAALLGVAPDEILFTAGASEANNTALLGALSGGDRAPGHVVSTAVEHPSVEAPLAVLERSGWKVTRLPVDAGGRVDADALGAALAPDTRLVSVIWANNETGVLQPVAELAARAAARGIPVHLDATQAVGKLPVDLARLPVDLLSFSAHKLGGPKGSGALVVRRGRRLEPLLHGGPQEGRRRGGTENVAGIAGLGVACELARRELPGRGRRDAALRDRLWDGIRAAIPSVRRNGSPPFVLPNTLNVEFEGAAGEALLQALDLEGVAASAGAACASGSLEPSPVLLAMGRSADQARASLRFSVGHGVDAEQVDRVLAILPGLVERARRAERA